MIYVILAIGIIAFLVVFSIERRTDTARKEETMSDYFGDFDV